jgi:hypothetical protein
LPLVRPLSEIEAFSVGLSCTVPADAVLVSS